MNAQFKAMLDSYARNLVGQIAAAVVLVGQGASPTSFTASQWADVSNVLWTTLIPVALRYINKKDAAFGMIAAPLLESAKKETAKAIKKTAKKAVVKKISKG
jgi:hypothetical protein